ncbi:MAG TPA: hypothetical protein DCG12_00765 [Planctomycetaceae bacterium]|nr:hypothetical protein [Planctomycetaceae bacterium]
MAFRFEKPDNDGKTGSLFSSGLVSVVVHALMLTIAGLTFRGCEKQAPAQAGGRDFREIGIATVPDASIPTDSEQTQPQENSEDQKDEQLTEETVSEAIPSEIPNVNQLLNQNGDSRAQNQTPSENLIGAGLPESGLPAGGSIPDLIRPRTGSGPAGSLTPGPDSTSFMNIVSSGQSFVYVIDTSVSMGGGRLQLAMSQLKASLRMLKPRQTFQIIFYDSSSRTVKLRNRPEQDMYPASDLNVLLAERAIDAEVAGGGTKHLPALMRALRLEADVIYFLTDGTTGLTRATLKEIREANFHGTAINVIEFASGAQESSDVSWLQLLASQSKGKYNYVPVR